jgi:PAS domain-containing protein
MFATRKKERELLETNLQNFFKSSKEEIKKRFETACSTQKQLDQAVQETQELTSGLVKKLQVRIKATHNDVNSILDICEGVNQGAIVIDGEGTIRSLNKVGERILGFKKNKIVGENFTEQMKLTSAVDYKTRQPLDLSHLNISPENTARVIQIVNDCASRPEHVIYTSNCPKLSEEGFGEELTARMLISCTEKIIKLNVMFFLVLGCNATAGPKDLTYVMMFSKRAGDLKSAAEVLYSAL